MKATNGWITRWYLAIQTHSFNIQHIPGKVNSTADFLSRCSNKTVSVSVCVWMWGADGRVCWLASLHSPMSSAQLFSVRLYRYTYTLTLSVYPAQVCPTAMHVFLFCLSSALNILLCLIFFGFLPGFFTCRYFLDQRERLRRKLPFINMFQQQESASSCRGWGGI